MAMSKAKRYKAKEKPSFNPPKGTLLYLFLGPLFLSVFLALFQTNIKAFIYNSISFALFLAVLTLAKKGFTQETIYNNNTFTNAPKVPYKKIAAYLLGIATLFTAFIAGEQALGKSLFLAMIAMLGYYLSYGFDPKEDKFNNLGDISSDFVLKTIQEAQEKLADIEKDMQHIKDSMLHKQLDIAIKKSKNILHTIQKDPKDIRTARKFLMVYIDGIKNVTQSYVSMEEKDINTETKENLYALMQTVEEKFDAELIRLKQNNHFDLDVHIDVLQEQLK